MELSIVHPSFCPTLGKKGQPLRQSVASGRWFNQPCLGKEASMKPRGWGSESGQVARHVEIRGARRLEGPGALRPFPSPLAAGCCELHACVGTC